MRALLVLLLSGGVLSMAQAASVHYVDVVNDSASNVTAVSATMDGMRWEPLAVGYRSLQANSVTTLAVQREGGCRRGQHRHSRPQGRRGDTVQLVGESSHGRRRDHDGSSRNE